MAGNTVGLARVSAPAGWLLGSPWMRRLLALQTGVLLASGVAGAMALQQPSSLTTEPLALVSALPQVPQAEALAKPLEAPPAAAPVSRSSPHPRPPLRPTATVTRPAPKKPAPKKPALKKAAPKKPMVRDWAYWAPRIRRCESNGDYRALNPDTRASGAYQILDTTWEGRYGVVRAADATPAQQDEVAHGLYRTFGLRPWAESAPCWS